ncbi:MAG: inositol 2-dehydrogenase [Candidatus Marinimicrobia bacterium]|jgi:myo-inositol 2-dehydrogenase / D-chiro-inositol 1-dehydrogenase|nr:inositol 2-dehydrogenase [Candidatus Neomarinimicrobiota bacterium]
MNNINLAIVGFGRIGKIHASNILASENINLKIIIDPILDINEKFTSIGISQSKEIDDLLNLDNIDGVIICSPSQYHIEQIKQISQKTKNIFCEKPLGLSVNEIMDVKSLVTVNKLNLHVGFNRRYDPDFSSLKTAISNGEIGDIHTIKITSRDPSPPPISYIKNSGGIFLDMTIHDFDMVKYLSGSEISKIYVKGGCFIDPEIEKANDIDTAIINMNLKSGVLATINNSRKAIYGYDQRVEVLGSKGTLKVGNRLLSGLQKGTKNGFTSANPKNFFIERYNKSYQKEISDFIESIKGKIVEYANVDDGLHALKCGLAANKSLLINTPVMV